jgi:hypothetical protein
MASLLSILSVFNFQFKDNAICDLGILILLKKNEIHKIYRKKTYYVSFKNIHFVIFMVLKIIYV